MSVGAWIVLTLISAAVLLAFGVSPRRLAQAPARRETALPRTGRRALPD